ncbi:MAG: hypothetical protein V4773_05180, partial [Verrucomicrobiota bacterium]
MKRHLLVLLALGASLLSAGYLLGQNKAGDITTAPTQPAAKQQKLVRVKTLTGVEENRQFQQNMQLVQAQRQAAIEIQGSMDKETDPKKKADLKKQFDQILARLNENNDAMTKAYGFSLARNYIMEIETAHIYLLVSDEEAVKIEAEQKAAAAKDAKDGKGASP